MKKIYEEPQVEVIKIGTCAMIAASLPVFTETVSDEDVLAPDFDVDVLTPQLDLDSYFE